MIEYIAFFMLFVIMYISCVIAHEMGHYMLILLLGVPYRVKFTIHLLRLTFHYKANASQTIMISLAGIIIGLIPMIPVFIMGYGWLLLLLIIFYIQGCGIDFLQIWRVIYNKN